MKIKNSLFLIIPIVLTGCGNASANVSKTSSASTTVTQSSGVLTGSNQNSSKKPFDSTPYSFEAETIDLPSAEELRGNDWIGRCFDITEIRNPFFHHDTILFGDSIIKTDWMYYEVLLKVGAPVYASEDHKPVLEFDSILVNDLDKLPETQRLKNTNIDIPTGSYKDYLDLYVGFHSQSEGSKMSYHVRANAIYYTQSFPAFATFKEELSSNLTTLFINQVNDVCKTNTKEGYAEFFSKVGTHMTWSCSHGMGAEMLIECSSTDYDFKEIDANEVKDLYDSAALSGLDSKTVGERDERRGFSIKNYLNLEPGKYVFEMGRSGSLYGGPADFPSSTISGFSNTICSLLTTKTEYVKESSFLSPKEIHGVWEILPSSMDEQKTLLENAYVEYVKDKAEYYDNLYNDRH